MKRDVEIIDIEYEEIQKKPNFLIYFIIVAMITLFVYKVTDKRITEKLVVQVDNSFTQELGYKEVQHLKDLTKSEGYIGDITAETVVGELSITNKYTGEERYKILKLDKHVVIVKDEKYHIIDNYELENLGGLLNEASN